ncbi:hypothetical protein BR93DRAFT_956582 [Coniochaeta sp. PMI_546]|nr:hypothetical protein BR93DRAFT_956582 [Coniochaeta sp. PMI_546]
MTNRGSDTSTTTMSFTRDAKSQHGSRMPHRSTNTPRSNDSDTLFGGELLSSSTSTTSEVPISDNWDQRRRNSDAAITDIDSEGMDECHHASEMSHPIAANAPEVTIFARHTTLASNISLSAVGRLSSLQPLKIESGSVTELFEAPSLELKVSYIELAQSRPRAVFEYNRGVWWKLDEMTSAEKRMVSAFCEQNHSRWMMCLFGKSVIVPHSPRQNLLGESKVLDIEDMCKMDGEIMVHVVIQAVVEWSVVEGNAKLLDMVWKHCCDKPSWGDFFSISRLY